MPAGTVLKNDMLTFEARREYSGILFFDLPDIYQIFL
jgi:hypothetical protein